MYRDENNFLLTNFQSNEETKSLLQFRVKQYILNTNDDQSIERDYQIFFFILILVFLLSLVLHLVNLRYLWTEILFQRKKESNENSESQKIEQFSNEFNQSLIIFVIFFIDVLTILIVIPLILGKNGIINHSFHEISHVNESINSHNFWNVVECINSAKILINSLILFCNSILFIYTLTQLKNWKFFFIIIIIGNILTILLYIPLTIFYYKFQKTMIESQSHFYFIPLISVCFQLIPLGQLFHSSCRCPKVDSDTFRSDSFMSYVGKSEFDSELLETINRTSIELYEHEQLQQSHIVNNSSNGARSLTTATTTAMTTRKVKKETNFHEIKLLSILFIFLFSSTILLILYMNFPLTSINNSIIHIALFNLQIIIVPLFYFLLCVKKLNHLLSVMQRKSIEIEELIKYTIKKRR
ncbi:hypothetical protein SNEBB_004928 [Seison nebaliae]|nr:hypothetical protein SNEBB_004928 [Seison nebaliae]